MRGLAAIAVVLYHMGIIEKKYSEGNTLLPAFFKIGQSGVDLFFVISGFIMVTITKTIERHKIKIKKFLLHRFARIYPNYWFYFSLTFLVFLIQPQFVNSSQGNHFDFITSFFLLPSNNLPLVLVGWSLIYEIYFYLIFSGIMQLKKKLVILLLSTWLIFLILTNLFLVPPASAVLKLLMNPYSIEFIFGAFCAFIANDKKILRLPLAFFLFLITAVILSLPFLFLRFYSINISGLFIQSLVFGILFSVFVLACVAVEKKTNIRFPNLFIKIGDASYTIYLSHVLILGFWGRLWASYLQRPAAVWDNIFILTAMLTSILIYSIIAYRLIERPSYNFFINILSFSKEKGSITLQKKL